jgi:serine O-acetyltransferase
MAEKGDDRAGRSGAGGQQVPAPSGSLMALIGFDLRAKARWLYGSDSFRNVVKARWTDGSGAMVRYRLMQWSRRHHLAPLAMLMNKMNVLFSQCIIGRGADFGPDFVLIHSQGIVINTAVRGGRGVHLEHQVTIGAEKGGAPVLGDNVFVGAGAKILGAVRIGSNVRIGANAVVLDDIPDNCTAVGIPARVVQRKD